MMRSNSAGRSGFRRTGGTGARLRMDSKMIPAAVPAKWLRAGRHFIEHHPEREYIRASVQRLCADLLRRHVRHRPRRVAWTGQERIGRTGCLIGGADRGPSGRRLREPEIQNLRPSHRQEYVRGLDVTMHDALTMRSIQGIGHGEGEVHERRDVYRAAREPLLECLAFEQFHRDERRIGADIVDGADVGVVER